MSFANPDALALLLALPMIWAMGWPRQRRRRRDILSLLLRSLLVILLILALAGLQSARATDRLAVVFVIDRSDSLGQDAQVAAEAYIREAITHMAADDRFGLVSFGRNALIERPVSATREWTPLRGELNGGQSNLAEGLRKALALFPPDAARRIVLLSDGVETVGDAAGVARMARAAGVEISTVSLNPAAIPDARVTQFQLPALVSAGQEFDAEITIEADRPTAARVTIDAAGRRYLSEITDLSAGRNQRALTLKSEDAPGNFLSLELSIEPLDPAFSEPGHWYQNDRLAAITRVAGAPTALLIQPQESETLNLRPALESAGWLIQQITPASLPNELSGLAPYDVVVLANVPALDIPAQRLQALEEYVRDFGGGLVVIGGENAYAPGGYADTALERVLPLEMRLRDEQRLPRLNLIYVIDHSGSMGETGIGGEIYTKLDYAREAIVRSLDYLQSEDRAAIIGFDASAFLISPFQQVRNARSLQQPVLSLRASGGTDILAGLSLAAEIIPYSQTDLTHIILLTDGGASEAGLVELAAALKDGANVSTSVVSISRAPVPFLREVAAAGEGQFHHVRDAASIPAIFAAETILATRSYIIEQHTELRAHAEHPILRGFSEFPVLSGYTATSARENARVLLSGGARDDPILAAWQYGLGRAVAFTSDAKAQWAGDWVNWDSYPDFWNQTLRWTVTRDSGNLETVVRLAGERAEITASALTDDGQFWNQLDLIATIHFPPGASTARLELPLTQVAPGAYQAEFLPERDGPYLIAIRGREDESAPQSRNGWTLSYSREYLPAERDGREFLAELAASADGRDRSAAPASVFQHDLRAEEATRPLRPALILAALLLLPVDIALRRLVFTREDWQALRDRFFPQRAPTAARARVAELLAQKRPVARSTARYAARSPVARGDAPVPVVPVPLPDQPAATVAPAANLGARLLRERRQRADRP